MTENQAGDTRVYSPYTLPQPSGLLSVREYLLTDMEERILLLRWVKEMEFPVDSMSYEITMLDAVGAELGRRTVTHTASDIPVIEPGVVFTLKRGIPVDEGCMNVRIRVTEVRSGAYVYRVSGHTVTADYISEEPWRYDPKAGSGERLTDRNPLFVRSKRTKKVHFLWPAAFLAALLIIVSIILPVMAKMIAEQLAQRSSEADAHAGHPVSTIEIL